jgi:hypothetical protein
MVGRNVAVYRQRFIVGERWGLRVIGLLFDHQPIPLRKEHKSPQAVGMIASTANMRLEHPPDGREIEKFLNTSRLVHQEFPGKCG